MKLQTMSILGIVFFAGIFRLLPHPPNATPIAALALFGGAYLDKKYALLVPLLAMVVSDLFLGFHTTMPFVYGSFLLVGLLGVWLRKRKTRYTIFAASLASSVLFFLITNFGVWAMGTLYPKTVAGLFEAYVMGVPFFRNTLFGDLFFTGIFFGGYELINAKLKSQMANLQLKS